MRKTLLITLEYPPMVGGVAHYYKNIVQRLPQDKIVVLDNGNNALLSTKKWMWPKWIKGLVAAYKLVKAKQIEHILVGQILPIGTIALLLYLVLGVKYTVMTHAMDLTVPFGTDGSRHKQKLMNTILRYAHRVTTVSSFTKMQLESLLDIPPSKVVMVYPCPHINGLTDNQVVDTQALDERYQLSGKKVMVSVGRLIQRKGVDYVLQAYARVAKKYPESRYAIVGDGPYRSELERLVQHYNLQDRVIFTGRVDDDELASWYARCDFLAMPSRELYNSDVEGFGIVYLEANSFGKPVIGGKSGGVLDVVIDGKNGYLVDPDSIEMIASAIERLWSSSEEAESMGAVGRERVEQMYQWSVQAQKIETMLSDV